MASVKFVYIHSLWMAIQNYFNEYLEMQSHFELLRQRIKYQLPDLDKELSCMDLAL